MVSTLMTFYNTHKDTKPNHHETKRLVSILQNFAPGFSL